MDLISPAIEAYAGKITSPESAILAKLNRDTHAKILRPRMLSGHLQGTLLRLISKMMQPERILEIGTFTGYSAICLAAGLKENGMLHTIDNDPELTDFARSFFVEAGMGDQIVQHTGYALDVIPTIDEIFDIVFIDADKENYISYFDLAFSKLRAGGLILADNVLWGGKVVEQAGKIPDEMDIDRAIRSGQINGNDTETLGILKFNQYIHTHTGIEKLLLPFRDGLMICMKA